MQQGGGGGGAAEDQKLGDLGIAEAASPISSRPPAAAAIRDANFEEMIQATAEAGGSGSGNRWPRQETLALLQIRSEMDTAFRDATHKGPLWEQVSRKLGELGYRRSAKKCKEKFENVHKYYKRTKEGRGCRQDGKSYKFFTQLEALHHNVPAAAAAADSALFGISFSSDSSSSDDGEDEEMGEMGMQTNPPQRKRKKGESDGTMMKFFEGLLKQVMQKQEVMQEKFLEAIEKRESDRMIREEAWKRQDMARIAREHEIMAQERAVSASRDAAIVDFLQKITGQTIHLPSTAATPPTPTPPAPSQTDTAVTKQQQQQHQMTMIPAPGAVQDSGVGETSSSRWPKPEVLALIKLRSGMEPRYQEPGPKGPLWEEISRGMQQLGYSRSAKRCKEKWENINKYFKKVKESNKKRPQDAKTCPYFNELDALYRRKVLTATNVDVGATQGGASKEDRAEQQQTPAAFPNANPKFGGGEKQPADTLDKGHQQSWGDTYCNTIHCSNSDEDNYEEVDETNVEEYDDKDMKMVYNNIQFQRQNVGSSNGAGGASSFVAMVQ